MKILVVGGGGREHAIVWALGKSPMNPELFIAPGNPGTAGLGTNVPIAAGDIPGLMAFAKHKEIDLTVVGPEQPLVAGIVDAFEGAGLDIFGPSARAAELEGSKAFAKDFMARHGIPTADYRTFSDTAYEEARAYLESIEGPCVLKASGLAAGKGVLMCPTRSEAFAGLDAILRDGQFGDAGASVVIEEWMQGEEASLFALTDGEHYVLLATAQDHKRIGDGDTGPNTGGMGAYAPAPVMTQNLIEEAAKTILEPTLKGLADEGRPYVGVLYCGLMITGKGPKVVEFNCRFGDPETQVVLPLLQNDFLGILCDLLAGKKPKLTSLKASQFAACVVMASEGYPGSYEKGKTITGLQEAEEAEQVVVFHAGTKEEDGGIVTAGGRVLAVSACAGSLEQALENAYGGVASIHFDGAVYRNDIGQRGLAKSRK